MVIASNANSSLQDFELIQVNTSVLAGIDGRDKGTLKLANEVILIVAFLALITLMCRKRKYARRSNYY
jgi:hypothetical protein